MGFILPALGMALANKVLGGGQQQPQQQLDFSFKHKPPRMPNHFRYDLPQVDTRSLASDPITAAMLAAGGQSAPQQQTQPQQSTWGKTKDEFMSALTQNLVQRMIFGGGQPTYQYAPPTFR